MSAFNETARTGLFSLFVILILAVPTVTAYFIAPEPDMCAMYWGSGEFGFCPSVLENDLVFEDEHMHWPPLDVPLTAELVTPAQFGWASLGSDGLLTYVPYDPYFVGWDGIDYRACYLDTCALSSVGIYVGKSLWFKDAVDDHYSTDENTQLVVPSPGVRSNDDCDAEINNLYESWLMSGPNHGILTLRHDGSFEYLPDADFTGTDSFTYRLYYLGDSFLFGDPATVTITVIPKTVIPEFPSIILPAMLITGFLGTLLYIRRTRGN